MLPRTIAIAVVLGFCAAFVRAETQDYPITPVPFTEVHFTDSFWLPRLETNRTSTIPYAFQKCEETGRIENFKVAGGLSDKTWQGEAGFNDSDVSKVIEGACYCLAVKPDPKLEKYLDDLVSYYAAAQEKDGYLYTFWTARKTIKDPSKIYCRPDKDRWDNIGSAHQMYNAGHMYEAAVAHYLATGKRSFLEVAMKNADHICATFNANARHNPPGHEEIEIGLAKLYRATGDRKYLDQAKFFLEQRGRPIDRELYGEYAQDHKPVVEINCGTTWFRKKSTSPAASAQPAAGRLTEKIMNCRISRPIAKPARISPTVSGTSGCSYCTAMRNTSMCWNAPCIMA